MLVGSEIVNPKGFRSGRFTRGLAVKEKNVCFHSLRIENAGRQAQERMHVAFVEQLSSHLFSGSALKKHVIRDHDCRSPVDFQKRLHVLQEIELFVARRGPEIVSVIGQSLFGLFAFFVDDGDARFLAEGGIRQHNVVILGRRRSKAPASRRPHGPIH